MRPYILLISLALSSCAASQCPQLYMNRTRGSAPCYFTDRIRPRRFRECPLRRRPAVYRRPGRRTAQRQMGVHRPLGRNGRPPAIRLVRQFRGIRVRQERRDGQKRSRQIQSADSLGLPDGPDRPERQPDHAVLRVHLPGRDKVAFVNDGRTDFADTRLPEPGLRRRENGAASIRKARLVVPCVYELAYLL